MTEKDRKANEFFKTLDKRENVHQGLIALMSSLKGFAAANGFQFDMTFKINGYIFLEICEEKEYLEVIDGVVITPSMDSFFVYQEKDKSYIRDVITKLLDLDEISEEKLKQLEENEKNDNE